MGELLDQKHKQEWQWQDNFEQNRLDNCKSCNLSENAIRHFMKPMGADCNYFGYNTGNTFEPALERFVALVGQECSWLQIHGQTLHRQEMRRGRGRDTLTLRFFVRGLPWVKRAKWQQPLLWAVFALLQLRGAPVA